MPIAVRSATRPRLAAVAGILLLIGSIVPFGAAIADGSVDHLVISELATGGASASDELIELYNPATVPLPLEGLELVYVTASGATISRRAAWDLGAAEVPAGGHVLVANEAGLYAGVADTTYASGMASTGGSVALRIQGASSPIDALGWGTATSVWLEGTPAPAPAPGASLERLLGGAAGSGQDTDNNAADFAQREVPEPQNLGSPPTPDPANPPPAPVPTPEPTQAPPEATPAPPQPGTVSIVVARALADGSSATIEGVALTASDFHDGGGFVADGTGGIAVLVTGATFLRGVTVRLTGEVDDRFSQRTLRVDAAGLVIGGTAAEPMAPSVPTASVNESVEGQLVRIGGQVVGSPTVLTSGLAFDVDDGTGPVRVLVGTATGISTDDWTPGATIELVGVVGQRDSSGTGTAGYRVMPRAADDVLALVAPSPAATPTPTSTQPVPSASELPEGVVSVAAARAASKNTRLRVQGVVTLPPGVVDEQTTVIQDSSAAIVLRLGDEVGPLAMGELIEVNGTRSTLSGMETLRVTTAPRHLGTRPLPPSRALRTGDAGESLEASVIVVRGAMARAARRSSSGSVSFDLDDGSGTLKVFLGAALGADVTDLPPGAWIEVTGILGQETTGALPDRGYRVWPASVAAVRIVAAPDSDGDGPASAGSTGGGNPAALSLANVGAPDLAELRVGATLVVGPWPELEVGGLLWDGQHLVAIAASSIDGLKAFLGRRLPPVSLELGGLHSVGTHGTLGMPIIELGDGAGDLLIGDRPPTPPATLEASDGSGPAWIAAVGRLLGPAEAPRLAAGGRAVDLKLLCPSERLPAGGVVGVTGVRVGNPPRMMVPCGGLHLAPTVRADAARLADGRAPAASASILASTAPGSELRRLSGAGMLLLAALTLLAAAIRRRRRPPLEDAADDEPLDDSAEASATPFEPPRLTLVSVPREHGP